MFATARAPGAAAGAATRATRRGNQREGATTRAATTTTRRAMRVRARAACKLTTSVIAPNLELALRDVDDAVRKGADVVELRVDFLRDDAARGTLGDAIEALIKASPVPVIVTNRPTWEGGQDDGDESARLEALWRAHECLSLIHI